MLKGVTDDICSCSVLALAGNGKVILAGNVMLGVNDRRAASYYS